MEIAMMALLGVALAAAAGFRLFVPFLVVSIAALSGHLGLSPDFAWIGTWPALIAFIIATVLEIVAYYVPWLDNLLDTITVPAAIVAGTVLTAGFITDMSPVLRWGLAIVAGGGAAGITSLVSSGVRAISSGTTGGMANSVVSTVETGTSTVISTLSVIIPALGIAFALVIVVYLGTRILRRRRAVRP